MTQERSENHSNCMLEEVRRAPLILSGDKVSRRMYDIKVKLPHKCYAFGRLTGLDLYISYVKVKKVLQNQGIGRRMMQGIACEAIAQGAETCTLLVVSKASLGAVYRAFQNVTTYKTDYDLNYDESDKVDFEHAIKYMGKRKWVTSVIDLTTQDVSSWERPFMFDGSYCRKLFPTDQEVTFDESSSQSPDYLFPYS